MDQPLAMHLPIGKKNRQENARVSAELPESITLPVSGGMRRASCFARFSNCREEMSAARHRITGELKATNIQHNISCGGKMVLANEVIEGAARGERESQRLIYESMGSRVYRTVYRIVGSSNVDDVTQDIFLHLFANLHKFRFESEFSTWVHRLAVNRALQHLRRSNRKSMVPIESLADVPATEKEDPDLHELFEVALSRLDTELCIILDLKESQDLSYNEIAEIVGIPEGTVGSRLNRARRELKGHLLALGWEE